MDKETDTQLNSWAQSIFAIALFVENLDEAKNFYQKVFSLPLIFRGW